LPFVNGTVLASARLRFSSRAGAPVPEKRSVLERAADALSTKRAQGASFSESVETGLKAYREGKRADAFTDFIYQALDTPRYTLDLGFRRSVTDSLKKSTAQKLAEYMPWHNEAPERTELERQLKIMDAMTEEDKLFIHNLGAAGKQRIADASGTSYKEVTKLTRHFIQARAIHEWINSRAKRKKPIPTEQLELFQAMRVEPSPRSFSLLAQFSIERRRASSRNRRLVNHQRFRYPR